MPSFPAENDDDGNVQTASRLARARDAFRHHEVRGGLPRARLPTTLIIAIAPGTAFRIHTRFTVEGLKVISREAFTKRESRRRP